MCFSLIFNGTGSGQDYTVLYALYVCRPRGLFPWKGKAESYIVLRVNSPPKDTPCRIGIYFPFKTGEGNAAVVSRVPNAYMEEDKHREDYLRDLYEREFPAFDTVPWVRNFGSVSNDGFKKTLNALYGEDEKTGLQKFYEEATTAMSDQEFERWQKVVNFKQEENHGTVYWVHLTDERLLKPGARVILKITFDNAEAEHSRSRFWRASAMILEYPYGHLEKELCSRNSIISVLYYRFKILHNSSLEFEDGGGMEIRPPFTGVEHPANAEGMRFDRERNTIFLNLGREPPLVSLISWSNRRLELLLPIAGFLLGLIIGLLPFFMK